MLMGNAGMRKPPNMFFYEMDKRNIVSWNAVMTSFSYRGLYKDAFNVFRLMIDAGMLHVACVNSIRTF